jgi:hypothetical protein
MDMWTIGFAERLRFPASRASSESREMLAFAHIPTGTTANREIDIDGVKRRIVTQASADRDRSRHRNPRGYTLKRGSGCLTNGVHFIRSGAQRQSPRPAC